MKGTALALMIMTEHIHFTSNQNWNLNHAVYNNHHYHIHTQFAFFPDSQCFSCGDFSMIHSASYINSPVGGDKRPSFWVNHYDSTTQTIHLNADPFRNEMGESLNYSLKCFALQWEWNKRVIELCVDCSFTDSLIQRQPLQFEGPFQRNSWFISVIFTLSHISLLIVYL